MLKNTNQLTDPSKNLRNFFIQSSLTFNGNNLNTRDSKPSGSQSTQQALVDYRILQANYNLTNSSEYAGDEQ